MRTSLLLLLPAILLIVACASKPKPYTPAFAITQTSVQQTIEAAKAASAGKDERNNAIFAMKAYPRGCTLV